MRIIAGLARGRRLIPPVGRGTAIRPTADRAREALFNILGPETVAGAAVLDLFAGTGALGLEAISRGARRAVFVDLAPSALGIIRQNIALCGFSSQALVVRHDLLKSLSWGGRCPEDEGFEVIFLDPPYRQDGAERLLTGLLAQGLLAAGGTVVFEDHAAEHLPETAGRLRLFDRRRYGDTGFWFYRLEGGAGG